MGDCVDNVGVGMLFSNDRWFISFSNVDSDDAAALSEEEHDVEKQDEFEAKYNFRYEDPDQEFVSSSLKNVCCQCFCMSRY